MDAVTRNMREMQDRVNKLTAENKHIIDEYNVLQENARNSATQGNRAIQ
jgi:chromosome segregation ATPase